MIRSRLETAVLGASEPVESQIRSQLVEIVRSCQSELFRSYQQSGRQQPRRQDTRSGDLTPITSLETRDIPSTDMSVDLSAWIIPPSITDSNPQLPSNALLQSSSAFGPTSENSGFFDSAYDSQNFSFLNEPDPSSDTSTDFWGVSELLNGNPSETGFLESTPARISSENYGLDLTFQDLSKDQLGGHGSSQRDVDN